MSDPQSKPIDPERKGHMSAARSGDLPEGESGAVIDIEMTKLCARAMSYEPFMSIWDHYYPLTNDAQAMALVKRFGLTLKYVDGQGRDEWQCTLSRPSPTVFIVKKDLNRAIVECVAKMQSQANSPARAKLK